MPQNVQKVVCEGNLTRKTDREDDLDLLKCVMIILMISFHLVYIGDSFPVAKRFVYAFHMPVFLLLSGFFMNVNIGARAFCSKMLSYVIPYVVMESGYIAMASILPIREHIEELSFAIFFNKMCFSPIGPYWYLHTLVICGIVEFVVFKIKMQRITEVYMLMGIVFYLFDVLHIAYFPLTFYFLLGVVIRRSKIGFANFFSHSCLSMIGIALLSQDPNNYATSSLVSL